MMNRLIEAVIAEQKYNTIRYILENNKKIIVYGIFSSIGLYYIILNSPKSHYIIYKLFYTET